MPVNFYPNSNVEELEACLESLQRRTTIGEVSFATLPGGGQIQRTVQNTGLVDTYILRILYSLFVLAPGSYDNPYVQRIRKTLPSYV